MDEAELKNTEAARAAQQALNDAFFRAVEAGDLKAAEEALKRGADMTFAYGEALVHGNADLVRLLLDRGADPNAELSEVYKYQAYPITPLMLAVWDGHEDVAKLLLERGANCEHRYRGDDGEITPLGKAIEHGYVRLVEILLDGGASPFSDVYIGKQGGPYGQDLIDAVEWARDHGKQEIKVLIEERQKAARQKFLDAQAQTEATESAPTNESAETAADKAARASQQSPNDALLRAVKDDDLEAAKEALRRGANMELAYRKALMRGNAEMVGLMLDHGAYLEVEISFNDRFTHKYSYPPIKPLMIAVLEGHNEVLKLLLERGADPNCEYHVGFGEHHIKMANRWSDYFQGTITPLGYAIKAGDLALVKLLLEKGARTSCVYKADAGYRYSWGVGGVEFDAFDWAYREGTQEIEDFLKEWERTRPKSQKEINDSLYHAVIAGDLGAAEEAINKGADASYKYEESDDSDASYSSMPVLYVARTPEMVKLLLSHGADPDAGYYNNGGHTEYSEYTPCLMNALPSVEIVRLLLDAGASPLSEGGWKEMDWHRSTVLSKAERLSESDPAYLEIVKLFKEYASKSQTEKDWELNPKENSGGEDVD